MLEKEYMILITSEAYYKYLQFQKYFEAAWNQHIEWAVIFCQQLPIQNNNINKFAEAGIQIIKDIVFGLLAIAHNKLDSWNIGLKEDIEMVSFDSIIFKYRSSKNKNIWYLVDMRLEICKCNRM
ncbi:16690_t:CDS:2, partial [Gigaspora margarita]